MDPRSILSALMARGSGAPVGADEYQQLLAREQARYHGDRDAAVRSANIAGGFGNSTAQQFMHEQAAAPPAGMPVPTSRPDPMMTGAVPMPTPRPEPPQPAFPPDLPVSPMRPDNLTQMRDAARPRAPEPLPTDLAVSPMRPDNIAMGGPGPERVRPLPPQDPLNVRNTYEHVKGKDVTPKKKKRSIGVERGQYRLK
jgi:hypothetical protein